MNYLLTFALSLISFHSIYGAIIEPHILWEKSEIKTCFFSSNEDIKDTVLLNQSNAKVEFQFMAKKFNESNKKKIRGIITSSYSPEMTGIHFVGFEDCKVGGDHDVVILKAINTNPFSYGRPFPGRASMGSNGYLSKEGYLRKAEGKSYVALGNLNHGVIAHEFGHIAGLRHEAIVDEVNSDPRCQKLGISYPLREQLFSTAIESTSYDPDSIMNYCHLLSRGLEFNEQQSDFLSSQDKKTLKHFYSQP